MSLPASIVEILDWLTDEQNEELFMVMANRLNMPSAVALAVVAEAQHQRTLEIQDDS